MEEMSMTMKALQAGLSAEGVTMYLFWLGIVGMGAGSLYLFMMQSALSATYKKVAIVAGIICAVATTTACPPSTWNRWPTRSRSQRTAV